MSEIKPRMVDYGGDYTTNTGVTVEILQLECGRLNESLEDYCASLAAAQAEIERLNDILDDASRDMAYQSEQIASHVGNAKEREVRLAAAYKVIGGVREIVDSTCICDVDCFACRARALLATVPTEGE